MQTLDNAPLISNNNNIISTDSNQDENAKFENNPIKVGSQEKILHLQRGYKVWYRICIVFGISLVIFIASLSIAIAANVPILFIFTGLSAIGILYSFVMVTCCNGFITISPNEALVY